MNYEMITAEDPHVAELTRFVCTHPKGHFLQSPAWAKVKPLWQWQAVAVRDDRGNLVGAISVLLRKLPLGFRVAYAPRGPVCDRDNEAVLTLLASGLKAMAKQNRCLLTYLDPDEGEENAHFRGLMKGLGFQEKCSADFGGVQAQSVFRLSLENMDEESLMASFSPKTRYNIRLSQRKGVVVRSFSGDGEIPAQALEDFARLMKITGERDHFRIRNKAYFEGLLSALGENAVLYLAYLDEKAIAGAIEVFCAGKAWYLYGASDNQGRSAMPNYLLQWTMLCRALVRGCYLYDFRGVPGSDNPDDPLYGLYRFKKGFGGAYTRFTGLFICYHRPFLGRLFDKTQAVFRKVRRKSTT